MAQVTAKTIFTKLRAKKFSLRDHILSLLAYLAVIFLMIYIRTTALSFFSVFVFFLVFLPATVLFIEYTSLVEHGTKPAHFSKLIRQLFTNAFRSGRTFVLFSFKSLLIVGLVMLITNSVVATGVAIHGYLNNPAFSAFFNEAQQIYLAQGFSNEFVEFSQGASALLDKYDDIFIIMNDYVIFTSLIFVLSSNSFKLFTDMFIERQPTVPLKNVTALFFSDKQAVKERRRAQFVLFLIVGSIFTFLFFGGVTLFSLTAESSANIFVILLRTELIAFIGFVFSLPLIVRFNYYLYHEIAKQKRPDILRFSIYQLGALIENSATNAAMKQYLEIVKKVREDELKTLNDVKDEENSNDKNSH